MPNYRVPLLLWKDLEGCWTAAALDGAMGYGDAVAVGATPAQAGEQVEAFLQWWAKQQFSVDPPDFLDPELLHVRVALRPLYEERGRAYPCAHEVEFRVPCVRGRQEGGLLVCSLPTLGLAFHYYARNELRPMVVEAVRNELAGKSPQQLSRFLPPVEVRLDEVSIHVPNSGTGPPQAADPPTVAQIAQAIGHQAFRKRYSAAFQREVEVARLIDRLRQERGNVALVGEHGAGKSTILVSAVRELELKHRRQTNDVLASAHRYWLTAGPRLIAGMRYLGEWQQRCERVIEELDSIGGVLCVESLRDLLQTGGASAGSGLAAFFLPYLQNGELRLVAEATPEEFDACRRLLPGLADVFQIVPVESMDESRACAALQMVAEARSKETKVEFDVRVPGTASYLFHRFLPYQARPGKAARLVRALFDEAKERRQTLVGPGDVLSAFTAETGLPESLLRDELPLQATEVENWFRQRIVGQPEACRLVAEIIATFKAGLNDSRRPLASLLFCGPTGVGKTELAKTLANYLFGHGKSIDRLVRLDMSEYATPWAAERLLAKDDGSPSEFLQKVRQQPFVVVLLDEIEKACLEVFDMLLGVLDEGRLTDRFGRTTIFRSAVLIMTSNLGSARAQAIGFAPGAAHDYEKAVADFFRPEFFNRLDAVVAFQPLGRETCGEIVRKEFHAIAEREGLLAARLVLSATERLLEELVRIGFDSRYGARPLQRTLEDRVVVPLAQYLVSHPDVCERTLLLDLDPHGRLAVCEG